MKKFRIPALLLALVMVLGLAACGDGNGTDSAEPSEKPAQSEPTADVAQPTPEPDNNTVLTAHLWELTYDEDDGWIYNEENDYRDSETYSYVRMRIPDPDSDDEYIITASIEISTTGADDFRGELVSYGIDEYEYAVNRSYPMVDIGGVECVRCEYTNWGDTELIYLGRDEASGTTLFIKIVGEIGDTRVDELLSGLSTTLTDSGNVDAPWYWDGEPFSGVSHETDVGSYTLKTDWIPFDESVCTHEIFNHKVVVYGEVAYVLNNGVLYQYAFDGASLSYGMEITLEDEYKNIDLANDGTIWLSNFVCPLISVENGETTGSYKDTDYAVVAPSGTWGISWFMNPEYEKFTLSDGTISFEKLSFDEMKSISRVLIDENSILACGEAADGTGTKVFVYDYSGNLKLTLSDEDGSGFGSISYVAETANGFVVLDGNLRRVVLLDKNGGFIGEADDYDLFGTGYPWFCDGCVLDDGSLLLIMTEERDDESSTELIAFKLSGF